MDIAPHNTSIFSEAQKSRALRCPTDPTLPAGRSSLKASPAAPTTNYEVRLECEADLWVSRIMKRSSSLPVQIMQFKMEMQRRIATQKLASPTRVKPRRIIKMIQDLILSKGVEILDGCFVMVKSCCDSGDYEYCRCFVAIETRRQ